jgi:hypothetical protein
MFESLPTLLQSAFMRKIGSDKYLVDGLSHNEKQNLRQFAQSLVLFSPSDLHDPDILTHYAQSTILDLGKLNVPSHAMIMVILLMLKELIHAEKLKYKSLQEFLQNYPEFSHRPQQEKERMREIANWMNILFKFIPAKVII